MKRLFVIFLALSSLVAAQTVLPVTGQPLAKFNLFPSYGDISQAKAAGLTVPTYNPARPFKGWAIPADFPLDGSRGIEEFDGLVLFRGNVPKTDASGKTTFGNMSMTLAEARTLNLWENKPLDRLPVTERGVLCPIDLSRWDPVNYYMVVQDPLVGVMVKDKRQDKNLPAVYTAATAQQILEIWQAIVKPAPAPVVAGGLRAIRPATLRADPVPPQSPLNLKDFALKLSFEGRLPGEEAYVQTLKFAQSIRETMDPAVRREFDALNLEIAKGFWGVFGIEVKP